MEFIIVGLLTITVVVINCLGYIVGYWRQTPTAVFLGTVQWPGDYFYYVSQFAQGKTHWFFSRDLYTNDFSTPVLVGWINVFLGKLFWLIGIPAIPAYALSLVLSTIGFGIVSYLFIRQIFPQQTGTALQQRLISFFLFSTSNTIPGIISKDGHYGLSYWDYWFNTGAILNRFNPVPHQMIAKTAAIGALGLSLAWQGHHTNRKKLFITAGLIISGLVCAGIEPVQWAVTSGVLALVVLWQSVSARRLNMTASIPLLCFGIGGLPMALYLKYLFQIPPYAQLSAWEITQNVTPSVGQFILSGGPILLLGIPGLWLIRKKTDTHSLLLLTGSIMPVLLFFSPLSSWLNIVNVRLLPAAVYLFLACSASLFISHLAEKARRVPLVVSLLLLLCLVLSAPSFLDETTNRLARAEPHNGLYYVPPAALEMATYTQQTVKEDETILSIWPQTISFPALTGRRMFQGHDLLTLNSKQKDHDAYAFLDGKLSAEEAAAFLHRETISYVLAYPWTAGVQQAPYLEEVHTNGYLSLFRVR